LGVDRPELEALYTVAAILCGIVIVSLIADDDGGKGGRRDDDEGVVGREPFIALLGGEDGRVDE